MKILLMGNPNVGKSVVFCRLTGAHVISSNYAGTTVEFTKGNIWIDGERNEIIDIPGTYTLDPTNKAEEVAVKMLEEGDLIINVVDATNLERNLYLTLQLLEKKIPVIVVLNMWDDTKHKGIKIDLEKLEEKLGVPVIPTVAVTGEGIKELVDRLSEARLPAMPKHAEDERWVDIGKIIKDVQSLTHRHHTMLERLEDITIQFSTGIPFAIIIVYLSFKIIRFIGEGLIAYLFDPFFQNIYGPFIIKLVEYGFPSGHIHDILLGTTTNFLESFGLLTTGLYVPIAMVLPYVFSFYLILSFLEDLGYLPRLAVLVDSLMHRLGLHGFAIIPMILGLGCNVPGALATRILETKREKFIAGTLMAIAVPCMAQTAMILGLVGKYGGRYIAIIYGTLFLVWVILGVVLDKVLKGASPEIFMEIPSYHIPHFGTLFKKLWMRIKSFLEEAIPLVLLGVLLVNILYALGIVDFLSNILAPVLMKVFGLPKEVTSVLIIGFLRKDVAVGLLEPLHLTIKQIVIACTVLTIYFPCVATFFVLLKEFGFKDMLKSVGIMIVVALITGGALNLIL